MNKGEKFEEDLNMLIHKLFQGMSEANQSKLSRLKDRLVDLHKRNVVKINHSVMELVCAKHLIERGYEVEVEHPLDMGLTCDLFAFKGYGSLIVEVETGFVPPEHALDPSGYLAARIASKIVRYSGYAGKFALGIPPYYVLQFPQIFAQPPKERTQNELKKVKDLCDLYYHNPPVSFAEVRNARIHAVYIIDVDEGEVKEVDPEIYVKKGYPFSS
ncbi:MAG: hypothetical protein RMJ15_06875 [Nitrososphaerota archaeon]|nr:hypothetical protein [Nitrososphaerota archaeon]